MCGYNIRLKQFVALQADETKFIAKKLHCIRQEDFCCVKILRNLNSEVPETQLHENRPRFTVNITVKLCWLHNNQHNPTACIDFV